MTRTLTLVTLVTLVAVPFSARGGDKPLASEFDDEAFLKMVAVGGMFDVYLSETVGPVTRNSEVKKFAVVTVAGHIAASDDLKTVAKTAGIALPTKLDDTHQKKYETFRDYKGDNLERDFIKAMVQNHTYGVIIFTRASKEAKHPAVKAFAVKSLPVLQKHLELAKCLEK